MATALSSQRPETVRAGLGEGRTLECAAAACGECEGGLCWDLLRAMSVDRVPEPETGAHSMLNAGPRMLPVLERCLVQSRGPRELCVTGIARRVYILFLPKTLTKTKE